MSSFGYNLYDMAGAENEFVQPCRGPDLNTSPISEQRDQAPLQEDDITQRSISTQTPSTQFLEQPYGPVTADQLKLQDSLGGEFWSSENMASPAPCTSRTVAPLSASTCVPYLSSSQSGSVAVNEDVSQENSTSLSHLSHESFTALSLLSDASWESGIQSAGSDFDHSNLAANPPKIGTRFSRESSKSLTQWFENHYTYPYPSKEETKTLQDQTGLSKTQIKNWLANTRRREKMHPSIQSSRKTTAGFNSNEVPMDIPRRPGTPAVQTKSDHHTMGPLERWVDSPPESEPATVTAIAKAVQRASSPRSKYIKWILGRARIRIHTDMSTKASHWRRL